MAEDWFFITRYKAKQSAPAPDVLTVLEKTKQSTTDGKKSCLRTLLRVSPAAVSPYDATTGRPPAPLGPLVSPAQVG